MKIIETSQYKKDYRKIIQNKHMIKEKTMLDKIVFLINTKDNMHELINDNMSKIYRINKKKGNLKEIYTAKINNKLRLYIKPCGDYPYDLVEIEKVEFIKIDDKHYGED